MALNETSVVASFTLRGDAITLRQMGMNLSQGYERFGSLGWEKFDEVQAKIGANLVRYPGGTEAETLFDYANPFVGTAADPTGTVFQLTTPQSFLAYCAQTGTKATFVLATEQLLTNAAYGARDFDYSKMDEVRAYVSWILNTAGAQGIATFELGNEYATYMNAVEYGKVASVLGLIVDQEITAWYQRNPGSSAPRPDVAVQVWGVSAGEALSISDLYARNATVMAQFNTTELQAISATTTHYYYTQDKFLGQANAHTYANLPASLGYSLNMMKAWDNATGRVLDAVFSEWNVHFKDPLSFGLQQVPILLEMFQTLVVAGVDEMEIWSTMYNASALADYKGQLQASGVVMGMLAKEAVGMRVAEVPVISANYDIHAFTNGAKSYMFISSMSEQPIQMNLNLQNHLDRYDLASARVIGVDASGADGVYKTYSGLSPWEEPDAPIKVTSQSAAQILTGNSYTGRLNAHETVVLELVRAPVRLGSMAADSLTGGDGANDRIDAMASNDRISGLAGDDTLFGGAGSDSIWGGAGADRLWGGVGQDTLWGGLGNDFLEGRVGSDTLCAAEGNDYVSGGEGGDLLFGEQGADAFIFRSGETGSDYIGDFREWEGDFLVFEGTGPVSGADFVLSRAAIAGVVTAMPELLVHSKVAGWPVMAVLQDCGWMGWVVTQDGMTGATFNVY